MNLLNLIQDEIAAYEILLYSICVIIVINCCIKNLVWRYTTVY
jgi:hypothetical protein